MKALLLSFFALAITFSTAKAHDKITFKNKESFRQECQTGIFCLDFDLLTLENQNSLKEASNFVLDNKAIFLNYSNDGTLVHLEVKAIEQDLPVYQKLFYLMGLSEIEILEGDSKGVYSVDEFLALYPF